MSSVLASGLAGIVFGLALAAPPGPMNAVIAEESVRHGWGAGFRAGLGAMSADVVFFVLAVLGAVTFVERFPTIRGLMVGVGGLLMLYFAYGAARGVRGTFRATTDDGESEADATGDAGAEPDAPTRSDNAGFRKAFVLALTNPYQILFWLTVGVGLLQPGTVDVLGEALGSSLAGTLVVETGSPALLVGFFAGIACWISGFPAALVSAERRVDAFAPAVAALSAVVLAGFGVAFLADAARTLLG